MLSLFDKLDEPPNTPISPPEGAMHIFVLTARGTT